jgi:hypothetical protein
MLRYMLRPSARRLLSPFSKKIYYRRPYNDMTCVMFLPRSVYAQSLGSAAAQPQAEGRLKRLGERLGKRRDMAGNSDSRDIAHRLIEES